MNPVTPLAIRPAPVGRKGRSLAAASQTRRKPATKAEQRAEMIEQILDAAEYLFSKHGLYGVTLKDVAARVAEHLRSMVDSQYQRKAS